MKRNNEERMKPGSTVKLTSIGQCHAATVRQRRYPVTKPEHTQQKGGGDSSPTDRQTARPPPPTTRLVYLWDYPTTFLSIPGLDYSASKCIIGVPFVGSNDVINSDLRTQISNAIFPLFYSQ